MHYPDILPRRPARTHQPGRSGRSLVPSAGFSLIELAVAIFVITLLLGSILVPLTTQVEERRYAQTEQRLEQIKEALIGYAIANLHLPCPAKGAALSDGIEDRKADGNCVGRVGFLPWITLGVEPTDAWGNLFRYSADADFTTSKPTDLFTLDSPGDITIKTRDNAGTLQNLTNTDAIPAVVISHGKNGYGATGLGGIARFIPAGWAGDEKDNQSNDRVFYRRTRTERTAAAGGEFDDIVVWISPNILNSRMVAAGRLP